MEVIEVGLCESRHEMPVEDFVFGQDLALDVDALFDQAVTWLEEHVDIRPTFGVAFNSAEPMDEMVYAADRKVRLYVAGFTPALTAFIRACVYNGVCLSLMHYDRNVGGYVEQEMLGNCQC